jgi:hypothetical protein
MTPFLAIVVAGFSVFVATVIFGQIQSALASKPTKTPRNV